jgi:hypothetical protein
MATLPSCCFDTSAINKLPDADDRELLAGRLLANYRVLPTSVNVVEIASTAEAERRKALLRFLRSITGDLRPLIMPNKLIWRVAKAYANRDNSVTLTIGEEDAGFWHLLENPELAGDAERNESFEWKKQLEDRFAGAHRNARGAFQDLFKQRPNERPQSLAAFVRHFANPQNKYLYSTIRKVYKQLTGQSLSHGAYVRMMHRIPDWSLYVAGWGHEVVARAIRTENFGAKGKPGTLDLWCANYLPYCDEFVTDDHGQYKALRLLNTFVKPTLDKPARTRVWQYDKWREALLSNGDFISI